MVDIGSARLIGEIDRMTTDIPNDSDVRALLRNCRAEIHALAHSRSTNCDEIELKTKALEDILHYLDVALGDTDPNIPDDMTDEEIAAEWPVFWACQLAAKSLGVVWQ